ncbi:DNA/RNA non-specific endonuclease [Mycobacterium camsae]|uniref:DNA/RNA non-specific endonuclease n=1 Tax=Mycobacterium gordonae TaxID=1778 RepID=UPI001F122159|nr:DNA/RNA non-specific endonuclease [Mycobacterium gordonae]
MPTKSQILHADPLRVLDHVDGWKTTVDVLEQHAEEYLHCVQRPGGSLWDGRTAEAARERARQDFQAVTQVRDAVDAAARQIAKTVSSTLMPPLTNAKQIIENADSHAGVHVNEDLSISYTPPEGTSKETAEANAKTVAAAEAELKSEAAKWWAAELAVAQQIRDAEAEVGKALNFGAAIAAVGPAFGAPPASPVTLLSGQAEPSGGPKTWQDLVLPSAVPNSPPSTVPNNSPAGAPGVAGRPGKPEDLLAAIADARPGATANVTDTLAGVVTGKPTGVKPSAGSPLDVIAVASNPAVVEQQQAKVSAAQQAVAAAQAKVDSVAKALYTSAPGTGPPRSDLDAASRALFDARHNLTEQTATLAGLSQAREALGGQSVPIPALPEHADVQAFPAQPSAFAQTSRALSEGSFGLIPDVAKDIDVFTNWGHHSGADQTGAVLDAAGLIPIPGAKFLGEGIHLGVDAATAAHHADDAVHAFDDLGGVGHHTLDAPSPPHSDAAVAHAPPGDGLIHISAESGGTGAWNPDLNNPQPNTHYTVDNRFSYNTDDLHRSTDASGSLEFGSPSDRNAYQQGIAGGTDRLPGDHGGHIFGAQFGGPGEAINITAMDGTVNKSSYAALENEWKSLLKQGHNVDVDVQIEYPDNSMRPSRYVVNTIVDGKLVGTRFFDNY